MRRTSLLIAALLVCAAMLSWGGPQKEGAAAAGTTTAAGGFKESPDFAARVKAGTLPAVNLRLPPEPVVIQAPTVGKYGGSLNLLLIDGNAWAGELPDSIDGNPALMRTVGPGKYAPDMATSCTVASDFLSWTCVLRDGLKWSDGTPLTVEDAIFTVKDMGINDKVNIWAGFNPKSITKIDDKTIRYEFNAPIFKAESMIAAPTNGGIEIFQPMHYLRKWHIDYNPDANKIAKEEGFEQWFEALYAHFWWAPVTDANKPTFGPYINTQLDSSVRAWEANPFYHHVDQSGQQLPYIPKAVGQIVDPEVKNLRTIAGDVDLNWMQTSFDNFTLYQENAKANNQVVLSLPGFNVSEVSFRFIMTNPDPQKNALWMDARVRQGLSVAINRDEINKVVFLGQGTPGSVTFGRFTDLPIKPEWERAFAQFDMAMANRLLDQAGLNKRGANNVRLMPDGRPFNVVIEYGSASASTIVDTLELVEEYWEAVGVDVLLKAQAGNILGERDQQDASEIQVQPGGMVNYRVHKSSKKWNQWLGADLQIKSGQRTMADFPNGMPGVEPPAWVKHWFDLEQKYWNLPLTSPEAIAAANEISDFFAKEMITIGTVGYIPHLVVAKNTIGNIPTAFPPGSSWHGNLNRMIETLYFK